MRQTGLPVSIVVERSIKFRACDGRAQSVLLRQSYGGVVSLSTTRMAKKLNLQAGTEAEALFFANFDKPWGAGGECFHIDALGHEEDLV